MSRRRQPSSQPAHASDYETLEARRLLSVTTQPVTTTQPTGSTTTATTQPAQQGLSVTYYDNLDFTGRSVSRIDPAINFDWAGRSPDPAIEPDTFSARWTGTLTPRFSQQYTFHTVTDDGVRLWLNGQLLIDQWNDHAATEHTATITLQAGYAYDVRYEYYNNLGGSTAKLYWSSTSQSKQIVPMEVLSPQTVQHSTLSANPVMQAATTQPIASNTTRVHAWHNGQQPGMTPMIAVWDEAAVGAEVPRVAAELNRRLPGDRSIFIVVSQALKQGELRDVIRRGVSLDSTWYRAFFTGLAARGVRVDRIVLDYEQNLSTWGIPTSEFQAMYSDRGAVKRLPPHLQNIDRAALTWGHPGHRQFAIDWNQWAAEQRANALRAAIDDSAATAFGVRLPVTNYGDLRLTANPDDRAAVLDKNGWPEATAAIGTESSPALYLWTGQRQWDWDYQNGTGWTQWRYGKHPLWVRLVDLINTVRAGARAGDVVPWVSSPSWADDDEGFTLDRWVWEQLVRHTHAAGTNEFLLWNAQLDGKPADDDAFAAQVFNSLGATQRQTDLALISVEADQIVTTNRATGEQVVTRYADFIARHP